jgi:DNA mismatch endonuclease (patch repair protein)
VGRYPGKPDIVILKLKKIIFINECFWHQHKNCKDSVMPKSNKGDWEPKLRRNIEKQKKDIKKLKKEGWEVYIMWECQTKEKEALSKLIEKILE